MAITIGSASDLGISCERICNFYNEHWPRQVALGDKTFYQWQFIDTPVNPGLDDCCVALLDGEVIGMMGITARDFYFADKKCNGAELTTWIVAEQHRGKGIGPGIVNYLKKSFDIIIGMGVSTDALSIYLRSGFRYINAIPRYVHVINWNNITDFIEASPLAQKYANSQVSFPYFSISEASEEAINRIWKEFSSRHNSFSRRFDDLKWRYDNNPYFSYHYFIVNNNSCVSVRIDRGIDGFCMAHCVDIFGEAESYPAAISAAVHYAREQGADAIDFFCTNAKLNAHLKAMGLFSTLDHDFFKFPHLFHPVEIRTPATTSLILWAKEGIADLLDTTTLHITKQDADFDRPTIHGMKK